MTEPPILPTMAMATISPANAHICAPETSPIWVESPTTAKKTGSRNRTVRSSSRSLMWATMVRDRGRIAPNMKAPKMAWIPMASVAHADRNRPTMSADMTAGPSRSRRSCTARTRAASGRTTMTITVTNAIASTTVTIASVTPAEFTMATTTARMHQAVTSSTAAQVIASAPILVRWSPVSVRMRARTGKAVIAIDAPMKRANPVKSPLPTMG